MYTKIIYFMFYSFEIELKVCVWKHNCSLEDNSWPFGKSFK